MTNQQTGAIAAIYREFAKGVDDDGEPYGISLDEMATAILTLRAELATALAKVRECEADAARLDWLDSARTSYSAPPIRMVVGSEWRIWARHEPQDNVSIRAAIDAAREATDG